MKERYNRGKKESFLEIEADWQEGELLMNKVEKIMLNQERIEETAPYIYTERKDGVRPEYNIRTDRFDIAIDAMEQVNLQRGAVFKEGKVVKMHSNEKSTDQKSGTRDEE